MERTTLFNRCSILATTALAAVLAFGTVGGASATGYKQQGASEQSGAQMPQSQSSTQSQSGESQSVGLGIQTQQDIREVQQKLKQRGYEVGEVDGQWGQKTSSAVREFQQDQGLQASGEIDQQTLKALDMAQSESRPSSESHSPSGS